MLYECVGSESLDIEALFHRYGPMVVRRCRQLLRDEDEALDVCQDVFVQLLRRRDRLTQDHPSSLLYRIATNLCLNRIRDNQRAPASADEELLYRVASVDRFGRRAEARSVLDEIFAKHRESSRLIAVLHFVDGLTLQEVAREVSMSVSGVRKRLRGLRRTLHEMEDP